MTLAKVFIWITSYFCKYSTNPFHECASDCLEKNAQGRGKKHSKKQASRGVSVRKRGLVLSLFFGTLDKERTDMLDANVSARVAFLDVADGKKAFESSQDKCPFGYISTVIYRLKYPNERTEEKKNEAEVAEATMEVEYLKKKLEEMRMLLDECEGGMTEEVKVKFAGEVVNLLEKVRK